jgi:hypothetical protein
MLDSIGWEVVIIDECQNLRISKYLEKFKSISADFRLLLLSSPLKVLLTITFDHINLKSRFLVIDLYCK